MNAKPPRTAIVSFAMSPSDGGPYKSVRLFGKALNAQVYSFSTSQEIAESDTSLRHWEIPSHLWYPIKTCRQAAHDLQNTQLISSHKIFRWSSVFVYQYAKQRGIPYWVVPHGSMDPWVFTYGKIPKEIWWHTIGKRYFHNAAAIICATERERDKLYQRYSGNNCEVVYWPTETIDTQMRSQYRIWLRDQLNIGSNERILVYLGRFHSMKRPLETIRRFAEAKLSNTHLLLLGIESNVQKSQIEYEISQTKSRNIHYYGPVFGDEKTRILLAGDGFISLSYRENFNHSAAESMSAGLPLILSPGNDLGGSLKDIHYGWWLNTFERDEEITVLQEFDRTDSDKLQAMGTAAKQWVNDNLTFEKFCRRLESLRQKMLT